MHQSQSDRRPLGDRGRQSDRATFCEAPAAYIVETYFVLRMVIAGGAIVLPVALLVWASFDPGVAMMDSISAFYYTPARSVFVGILVAIGVALVAYRGYTRGENLARRWAVTRWTGRWRCRRLQVFHTLAVTRAPRPTAAPNQ